MEQLDRLMGKIAAYGPRSCVESDREIYTYAQLLEAIDQWKARFDILNITQGTVVGVRTNYSLQGVAALLALFVRRAVAALIPQGGDLARYLSDAYAVALLELRVNGEYEWTPNTQLASHPLIERLRISKDGGVIIFSSGSSGRPKAALQSVERLLCKFSKASRQFRTLAFLAFDHIAGLDTLFYALASGGTLILTDRRDPVTILRVVETYKVEVLPVSPSFLRMLCATRDLGSFNLASLRVITYGSEPMDPTTLARINGIFRGVQICQKYGTTETGAPRSVSRGNDSLWLKFKQDGVETKIVDGVLWIRSESAVLGYLNAPSPLDNDGWYCTGDLVDVEGEWVRFRGRASDLINVGGEKVAPTEVERTIFELEFVHDVVVTGEPHTLLGTVVVARVVLATGAVDHRDAMTRIRAHCRARLSPYKVPVRIDVATEIFVTPRQKIERTPISE